MNGGAECSGERQGGCSVKRWSRSAHTACTAKAPARTCRRSLARKTMLRFGAHAAHVSAPHVRLQRAQRGVARVRGCTVAGNASSKARECACRPAPSTGKCLPAAPGVAAALLLRCCFASLQVQRLVQVKGVKCVPPLPQKAALSPRCAWCPPGPVRGGRRLTSDACTDVGGRWVQ